MRQRVYVIEVNHRCPGGPRPHFYRCAFGDACHRPEVFPCSAHGALGHARVDAAPPRPRHVHLCVLHGVYEHEPAVCAMGYRSSIDCLSCILAEVVRAQRRKAFWIGGARAT